MVTSKDSQSNQSRKAAIGGLAVVGFIALILIGIATAIYAASYLPKILSNLGSANVYLSTVEQPTGEGNLEATNPQGGSIPLSPAPTQTAPTTTAPTTTRPPVTTPVYTPPVYHPVIVPSIPSYFGLPDLVTTITSVGYLRNSGDATSFVAADTVPRGYQGAVRFVIANHGTNVANSWYFEADLPTNDNQSDYRSPYQRALNPGASTVFTLGFDSTSRGSETIRVTAAPDNSMSESNRNNNTDSETIYLNGSSSDNNRDYDSNGNYCRYGTYYQNGRYYCDSSDNNDSGGNYDSNGNYCRYGTYYQNGRYYCDSQSNNDSNNRYDSNGRYCTYGTYYQNDRYYCSDAYGNNSDNNGGDYDTSGNYCQYGTYYLNGRYYCN